MTLTADSTVNQIIAAINSAGTPVPAVPPVAVSGGLPSWMVLPTLRAARTVSDLVTANNSAQVSSATANFTQADVGACIIVYSPAYANALNGTEAGNVQPTIVSVQSPTQATVSSSFIGTGTCTATIGQDNFAVLNTALAQAAKLGGKLLIPPGQFIINGINLFGGILGNVTIEGAGYGQSELIPTPFLSPTGVTPVINLNANATWRGLDINWLGVAYPPNAYPVPTAGFGMMVTGGTRIFDSWMTGWGNAAGQVLCCDSDDLLLDGVRIIENAATAFVGHSLNLRAINCEFVSASNTGFVVDDLSWTKMTNCYLSGVIGLAGVANSGGGQNNKFVNCRIDGFTYCVQTGVSGPPNNYFWDADFVGCVFGGGQASGGTPSPAGLNCLDLAAGTTVAASNCTFLKGSAGKAVIGGGTFIDGGGNQGLP